MRPNVSSAAVASWSIVAGSTMSPSTWTTGAPVSLTAATVAASPSGLASVRASRAPLRASAIAEARPIPLPAPVTMATLSFSRVMSVSAWSLSRWFTWSGPWPPVRVPARPAGTP